MVCRLVKKQHVGRLEQQFRKLDAHAPSARKLAGWAVEVLALEAQAEKRFLNILLEMSHVDCVELLRKR